MIKSARLFDKKCPVCRNIYVGFCNFYSYIVYMKIKGSMNEKDPGHFIRLQNSKLVGKDILTDTEIVVYGYIALTAYNFKQRRTIYKESIHRLALAININDKMVSSALKSLVIGKMLKKIKNGYEVIGTRLRGDYVMVIKDFLLSTQLTTSQKAFLLRIDALRREGLVAEDTISNGNLALLLNMSKTAVRNSVMRLESKDYKVGWISKSKGEVIIDYDLLKENVRKELTVELIDSREAKERLPMGKQLIRYGRIESTVRKKKILDDIDVLITSGDITLTKGKSWYKYVKEGRLKLVEESIEKLHG